MTATGSSSGLTRGLQSFLEGDRRRGVERELAAAMGRVVRVRMVDEAVRGADDPAAGDPVIKAGLRLFGGPLQPVDGVS